jgi:hypothetical protein
LETLVQKKDIKRSQIIEHDSYVGELARYIAADLTQFRKIQGDETLGGMVICETSEQARKLYEAFQNLNDGGEAKTIQIKLDGNISGLYLRIWTVWSAWSEARNVSLRNWTVCSPMFRNRQKTCRSSVPV